MNVVLKANLLKTSTRRMFKYWGIKLQKNRSITTCLTLQKPQET